jgi:anti-sigma factor NepR-like protein
MPNSLQYPLELDRRLLRRWERLRTATSIKGPAIDAHNASLLAAVPVSFPQAWSRFVQMQIGARLRSEYDVALGEDVPEHLADLMRRLNQPTADAKAECPPRIAAR